MRLAVLVADDHDALRKGVRLLLETKRHWSVVEAVDGWQAIDKAQRFVPDVAILDMSMPGLSGLQTAVKIREVAPTVKIVFFTNYDESCLAATDFASSPCVPKSNATRQLIPTIERLVELGEASTGA